MRPSWDTLTKEKRQELLQIALQSAKNQGASQVNLITKDGKPAGFASETRLEVIMP